MKRYRIRCWHVNGHDGFAFVAESDTLRIVDMQQCMAAIAGQHRGMEFEIISLS